MLTREEIIEEITRQIHVSENDCKTPLFIICDKDTYGTLIKDHKDGQDMIIKDNYCAVPLNYSKYGTEVWGKVHPIELYTKNNDKRYFIQVICEEVLEYYSFIRHKKRVKK